MTDPRRGRAIVRFFDVPEGCPITKHPIWILYVNGVSGSRFHMNRIPHTLAVTTLGALKPGARMNLEVDLVARYVARLNEV